MRNKRAIAAALLAAGALLAIPAVSAFGDEDEGPTVSAAAALGDGITYQGRLTESGAPANGVYDIRFILYDAITGGTQVGSIQEKDNVNVAQGLFTVFLEFGATAFDGEARWIEIAVRPGASAGTYQPLAPRQVITATPYALVAKSIGIPFAATGDEPSGDAVFEINNDGDGYAILATRNTTATAGDAIVGINSGAGAGVRGNSFVTGGRGVLGHSDNVNGVAVEGSALSEGSVGGRFEGDTGVQAIANGTNPVAIELDGGIRVTGATRPAFTVVADSGTNTCLADAAVVIDHPLANSDSGALLFVTARYPAVPATPPQMFGVGYDLATCAPGDDKWAIVSDAAIPDGTQFNILVVKSPLE
ncbi:MAG: hypothetical protein IT303_19625 [Dehalococcoidia bacterium]|nr:hypothetical protein [Dehalococcoidia bacterium]